MRPFILALALLVAASALAQVQPEPPTQTPQTQTLTVCPASFYATGVSYSRAATPNVAGWLAVATPITRCGSGFQAYSVILHNATPVGHGSNFMLQETTTTGFAIPYRQLGSVSIYTFGTVGVSVSGGVAGLGLTGGWVAYIPAGHWGWGFTPWAQVVKGVTAQTVQTQAQGTAIDQVRLNSTNWSLGIGIGKSF